MTDTGGFRSARAATSITLVTASGSSAFNMPRNSSGETTFRGSAGSIVRPRKWRVLLVTMNWASAATAAASTCSSHSSGRPTGTMGGRSVIASGNACTMKHRSRSSRSIGISGRFLASARQVSSRICSDQRGANSPASAQRSNTSRNAAGYSTHASSTATRTISTVSGPATLRRGRRAPDFFAHRDGACMRVHPRLGRAGGNRRGNAGMHAVPAA